MTAAALDVAAPLRAKRVIRDLVLMTVTGPAILAASFFVPAAAINLDGRLRVLLLALASS